MAKGEPIVLLIVLLSVMDCGLWYLPRSISRLWHPTLSRVIDTRNVVDLTFNKYDSMSNSF